jgi:hypothetical protein
MLTVYHQIKLHDLAFPDGIPEEIWTDLQDHRFTVAGDNGIVFLPRNHWGDERQKKLLNEENKIYYKYIRCEITGIFNRRVSLVMISTEDHSKKNETATLDRTG